MLKFADPSGAQVDAMLGLTPEQVQALYAGAGADLYRTWDGKSWGTVTRTGFGDRDTATASRNIVEQRRSTGRSDVDALRSHDRGSGTASAGATTTASR